MKFFTATSQEEFKIASLHLKTDLVAKLWGKCLHAFLTLYYYYDDDDDDYSFESFSHEH